MGSSRGGVYKIVSVHCYRETRCMEGGYGTIEAHEWGACSTSNHMYHSVTHRSGLAVYSCSATDERDGHGTAAPWDHKLHHTHYDQRHPQDQRGTLRAQREETAYCVRAHTWSKRLIKSGQCAPATISAIVLAISLHGASQYEMNRSEEHHFTVMKDTLSKQEPCCSCGEELLWEHAQFVSIKLPVREGRKKKEKGGKERREGDFMVSVGTWVIPRNDTESHKQHLTCNVKNAIHSFIFNSRNIGTLHENYIQN